MLFIFDLCPPNEKFNSCREVSIIKLVFKMQLLFCNNLRRLKMRLMPTVSSSLQQDLFLGCEINKGLKTFIIAYKKSAKMENCLGSEV